MRAWIFIPALVLLAAKGDAKVVLNHARILDEPKYWAHHAGDVDRGDKVTVLKQEAGWAKIKTPRASGYVPMSAFVDNAVDATQLSFEDNPSQSSAAHGVNVAQAANASRGFSSAASAANVDANHLQDTDALLDRYEGKGNGAALEKALSTGEPAFISNGHLLGGGP